MTHAELLRAYRQLRLLREFEERTRIEFQTGQIAGFTHLYAGMEAIAVGVCEHLGNDDKKDSRGSKVQVDKPDAVMVLARTDDGVKLTCKAARTEALLRGEMHLVARGLDGSEPIVFRESTGSWPAGTAAAVKLLDRLAVPSDASRSVARAALKAAGHGMATEVLAAAVRAPSSRRSSASTRGAAVESGRAQASRDPATYLQVMRRNVADLRQASGT